MGRWGGCRSCLDDETGWWWWRDSYTSGRDGGRGNGMTMVVEGLG